MSSLNGIGVGIPYATYEGTGSITDSSTFYAPLETSLILQRGTGDPTWSRATKAWGFNELGYLEELASGCAFFGGARLVRNTVRTTSEDFSNAAWVKSNCTVTGTNTIVCANATSLQRISQDTSGAALVTGMKMFYSFRVSYVSGGASFIQLTGTTAGFGSGQYVNFSLLDGTYSATGCTASSSLVSPGVYDISCVLTATATANQDAFYACFVNSLADARFASFTGDGVKSFQLLRAWSVDVTNYDASYVPEYVSVGVLSAPFHGAGIDGAKYFNTGWNGSPLTCLGFRREAAATNNLLYSRDLTRSANGLTGWNGTQIGSEILGTLSALNARSSLSSGTAPFTITCISANGSYGATFIGLTVGKTYEITCTISANASGKIIYADVGSSTITVSSTTGARSLYRVCAGNTSFTLYIIDGVVGESFAISAISIKDAAVQTTTTTGLDGIANTATTLTASAADAIILQPITLASAARCASAYVKRRTGTGTIYFTQDGGSTWTDITSQINSSTWSRVQITATLANPSVGFKISTSGDAIDVDCVQNEAGAVATSPIVTTTAAVTRNADSLTYQTAGNIDFAVGTFYCEAQFAAPLTARRAALIGADGLVYLNAGDANTSFKTYDGTTIVTKSGLSDISTAKRKRVISWGPTGLTVTGDGLAPTSGAFDGSFGSGATIEIGQNINGYIGPVAIYNYQMTDAQLQAITL